MVSYRLFYVSGALELYRGLLGAQEVRIAHDSSRRISFSASTHSRSGTGGRKQKHLEGDVLSSGLKRLDSAAVISLRDVYMIIFPCQAAAR